MRHSGNTVQSNRYNITGQLSWRTYHRPHAEHHLWYQLLQYLRCLGTMSRAISQLLEEGQLWRPANRWRTCNEQSQPPYGGALTSGRTSNFRWQWRAQVIYNWRPWEDHTLTINAGPEFRPPAADGIRTTEFGHLA